MTDLRKAANMALRALEFNYPLIEDYGNKEQLDIHHEAIMALYKSLAQPEPVNQFYPDWNMIQPFHERIAELEAQLAQPRKPWQGLTSEDWENTPDTDKQGCERDAELFDWIEQTLKDKNDTL